MLPCLRAGQGGVHAQTYEVRDARARRMPIEALGAELQIQERPPHLRDGMHPAHGSELAPFEAGIEPRGKMGLR